MLALYLSGQIIHKHFLSSYSSIKHYSDANDADISQRRDNNYNMLSDWTAWIVDILEGSQHNYSQF